MEDNWPPFQINGSRVRVRAYDGSDPILLKGDTLVVTMPAARQGDQNWTIGGMMAMMRAGMPIPILWSMPMPIPIENRGRMGGPKFFPPEGRMATIASMGISSASGDATSVRLTLVLGTKIPNAKYEKERFLRCIDWNHLVVEGDDDGDGILVGCSLLITPDGHVDGRICLSKPGSKMRERGIDDLDIGVKEGEKIVWISRRRREKEKQDNA